MKYVTCHYNKNYNKNKTVFNHTLIMCNNWNTSIETIIPIYNAYDMYNMRRGVIEACSIPVCTSENVDNVEYFYCFTKNPLN